MALNFDAYKEVIYSAVISDVMDQLGMPNQAMKPFMRPLDDASVFMGRARTGLYAPVFGDRSFENSYENEIKLVDSLTPGDVPVLACGGLLCRGGCLRLSQPHRHVRARHDRSARLRDARGGLSGARPARYRN